MKRTLILLSILVCSLHSVGQNPNDRIDLKNLNVKYLEHLIKVGIDSVRVAHNLKRVMNDSILYKAASYHAGYLMEKKILSHYQEDRPEYYSPQNRAEMFGAVNYLTGENVAKTYVHKRVTNKKTGKKSVLKTYKQTALNFVDAWVHSPPHYKNIITPDWEITGVAISADPETNEIKAVQKFGRVIGKYYFEIDRKFFPYDKFQMDRPISSFDDLPKDMKKVKPPYKLKDPKENDKRCKQCKEIIPQLKSFELRPKGRKLYLYSEDVNLIYQLINNRRDGFAIELVYFSPVDCGNPKYYEMPSRRNGYSRINGELWEPHYKKILKRKGFKSKYNWLSKIRKDKKVKVFNYKIAKLPKEFPEYYEMNVAIIQKKRLCYFKHLASLCTHANPDASIAEINISGLVDDYPLPPERELIPEFTERDIYFTVPFERGRSDYQYADVKPMIDTLTFDKFQVFSIDIKAYTSLEGSEKINKDLQLKRANSIVKAIEGEQNKKIPSTVDSKPNWELFKKQIEEEQGLKDLKGLSEEEILAKLKDRDYLAQIEQFLSVQRRADIIMKIRTEVNKENSDKYLVFQFNSLVNDIQRIYQKDGELTEEAKKYIEELRELQNYLYYNIQKGKLPDTLIKEVRIPDAPHFSGLNLAQLWMEAQHDPTYWQDTSRMMQLYGYLRTSAFEEETKPIWQYNFVVLYVKLLEITQGDVSPMEVHDLFDKIPYPKIKDKISKGMFDSLRFDLYARLVPFYYPNHLDGEIGARMKQCLTYIYSFYAARPMTDEKAFEIANYLSSYGEFGLAVKIMAPRIRKDKPHPGMLALMAKLSASHPDEVPNGSWYQWVIDIADKMPKEDWCKMFIGPCNISFQVFDKEPIYKKYCEHCKDVPNYVTGRGVK